MPNQHYGAAAGLPVDAGDDIAATTILHAFMVPTSFFFVKGNTN